MWLAEAVGKHTNADVVLVDEQLATKALAAGEVTPRVLIGAVPRVEVVRFTVNGSDGLRELLEQVHKVSPNVVAHVSASTADDGAIRVTYPCVDYAAALDRKAAGLDGPEIADFERIRDRSLWRIAVEAAREQKSLKAQMEAVR